MKLTTVCATAFILLVPVKLAQADDLGCNYSSLVGKEFVFREPLKPFKKPGVFGNKNTYLGWYSAPSDRSDHIGYEEHVGKKGKIQEQPVPDTKNPYSSSYWYVATLENCEKVYARSSIKSLSYLESTADIYFTETYQQAESVVGKTVWANINQKQRDLVLYTDDSAVSYPLSHLEPLTVVGLRTKGIGHSYGSGPFFLIVKKGTGEQGYVYFGSAYVYLTDPIDLKWDAPTIEAIKQRKIKIGMTESQVRLSWGQPERINKSVGVYGAREQWVYGLGKYVYIQNGKMANIQSSQ